MSNTQYLPACINRHTDRSVSLRIEASNKLSIHSNYNLRVTHYEVNLSVRDIATHNEGILIMRELAMGILAATDGQLD